MNKGDLINAVADSAKLTKTQASDAVDAVFGAISGGLNAKDDKVTLIGFGTFSVNERKARTGRNPQSGAEIKIAARRVVRFKPGKGLSDSVK
ncbi:MAG: HU family DNA-binding protein [Saprospiraceae bacterium]